MPGPDTVDLCTKKNADFVSFFDGINIHSDSI